MLLNQHLNKHLSFRYNFSMKRLFLIVLAILFLCSCSKKETSLTGDEFLDGLTFEDIKQANRIDRVLEDKYIYYERTLEDSEGNSTGQEYIEFIKMNGDMALIREAKYPGIEYSYQVCAKQESNESYGSYTIVDDVESVMFMDAAIYDLNIRSLWYLGDINSYVGQEITKRSYDDEGNAVLTINDKDGSSDSIRRTTTYTLNNETLELISYCSKIYINDKLSKKETVTIRPEERSIMVPVAYNTICESEDSTTISFINTKNSFEIPYIIKRNVECMVFYFDKEAHLLEDGSDGSFYHFFADDEHSTIYMIQNMQ